MSSFLTVVAADERPLQGSAYERSYIRVARSRTGALDSRHHLLFIDSDMPDSDSYHSQYPELLALTRELRDAGKSPEEILAELRLRCPSPIQSIKAISRGFGLDLGEAKNLVHNSAAWSDRREEFDKLHDDVEEAARTSRNEK